MLTINIAQFQPTLVDSYGSGSANEVTDGIVSNESSWASQDDASAHWAEIRLRAPYSVGSAQLYLGEDNVNDVANFDLQYHSGSSWQTITSVTGDDSTDHNLIFPATVTASRFRIHSSSGEQLRVKEFVLLPPNGPVGFPMGTGVNLNVLSRRAPEGTSTEGTNYAVNAVDGYVSNDSSWVSDNSTGPHRLTHRLPVTQKIRAVHLYSGEVGPDGSVINPISDFTVQYEAPGGSFQAIPGHSVSSGTISGGSVTGNTSGELVINFSWPVNANRIRISFNQASGAVREMVVFPANTSAHGPGYPIGTSVKFESPPATKYDDYGDAWYRIVSRQNNRALIADETGATQTVNTTPQIERQYELLYSYALDAYRIRAEDTGLALQVKDASLDAGAAIVEGTYSAAPHQLWRLEPTDGDYFQFVNVWSGMVLHTGGAYPNVVTQQPFDEAADPANNKEWRVVFIDDYFKKGTASTTVGSFGSSWSYDWARRDFDELPHDQFYAPMQFRQWWPNLTTLHQKYDDWNDEIKPSYLLGYNEPDKAEQANMSVDLGVELWPQLEAMDVPLVSPANAHGGNGRNWLKEFSDKTDALGYRMDYAATHWYSSPSVDGILNYVDFAQTESNGRDVWLTEFAVVDWSNGSGNWSEERNYNFILEFMYRAESKANLDKYSLFLWTGTQPATPWEKSNPRSDFFISGTEKELTPFGKAYAGWDGETAVGNDTLYTIHNRAAYHRLQNDGGSGVAKASIRVEDESVQWVVQDAGNDEVFITSAVDGRRAKLDAGNIVMSDPGATGWGVRWKIQQDQYGWQNIVHSGSGNYLRLNRTNDASGAPTSLTFDVVSASSAASLSSTDWWFVKPYEPATASVAPELVATAFDAISDHVLNGQTDVTFTVSNAGILTAADFETHIVWSANGVLGDADDVVVLGSETTVAGLAAGASNRKTVTLALNKDALYAHALSVDTAAQPVGTVSADVSHLFLVVDVNGDVAEGNEANNSNQGHFVDRDDITYFPWDENGSGVITPVEVITSIQSIGTPDALRDFDGNGIVTPLEALAVLQRLGYVRNDNVMESGAQLAAGEPGRVGGLGPLNVASFVRPEDDEENSLFPVESPGDQLPISNAVEQVEPTDAFESLAWLDVI